MAKPYESYFRMNTLRDLLVPCPICLKNAPAENGHRICVYCEGVEEKPSSIRTLVEGREE
jgi:hypothetical protein